MVKTLFMVIFCSIIGVQLINGLKCYVCDTAACQQPGDADKKDCSETGADSLSGKAFVNNAVGKDYVVLASDLTTEVKNRTLNDTAIVWSRMTEMVNFFPMMIIHSKEFRHAIRQKTSIVAASQQ